MHGEILLLRYMEANKIIVFLFWAKYSALHYQFASLALLLFVVVRPPAASVSQINDSVFACARTVTHVPSQYAAAPFRMN